MSDDQFRVLFIGTVLISAKISMSQDESFTFENALKESISEIRQLKDGLDLQKMFEDFDQPSPSENEPDQSDPGDEE